jgi:hydroxypyruvate isomerase
MPAGDRGVVSWPDRAEEFRRSLDVIAICARETGVRAFNALYGQRRDDLEPDAQDAAARANLVRAAEVVAPMGGTILLEPLTVGENGSYPLLTIEDCRAVVDAVREGHGMTNLAVLFDTYHLAGNGVDLIEALDQHADVIGHVQVADHPGRGEPGTGAIDFPSLFEKLNSIGYQGTVGCEYRPTGETVAGLTWLERVADP